MKISVFLIGLRLAMCWLEMNSVIGLGGSVDSLKQLTALSEDGADRVTTGASSLKCSLQGTTRSPAFSMEGDYTIGGAFSIHFKEDTKIYNYTTIPEPPSCTGRLVSSGERRNVFTYYICTM